MHPIVSACGTSTYNLAKYLTKILKVYIGHSSSFVKDSKDLTDKLQSIKLHDNEELVSFDVSALFTSIPVNQALDVINQLIIQHQTNMDFKYKVGKAWYEVADHLDREDVMALLKVVLNNCVFSFQGKLYKQLHGAAMGSPCSPVVANIHMEYFENVRDGDRMHQLIIYCFGCIVDLVVLLVYYSGCVDRSGSLSGSAFNQLRLAMLNIVLTILY